MASEEVTQELRQRREKPRLARAKRMFVIEVAVWTLLIPLSVMAENWVAIALILVVILKTTVVYGFEKLFIKASGIIDNILDILEKGESNGSTNARANRKK